MLKHGLSRDRIYTAHHSMKQRCYNLNNPEYKNYGGRGITVCDEWLGENGFINFSAWAIDNGYDQTLSIDRIDVNGNYQPDNCRWATLREQNLNKRKSIRLNIDEEQMNPEQLAKKYGLSYRTVINRIRLGWSVENLHKPPIKSKVQSGEKYIYWMNKGKKWKVSINNSSKGKCVHVGCFSNLPDAIKARDNFIASGR